MTETPEEHKPGAGSRSDATGEFFSVGTPLHAVRAGYIRRRADDLLYEAAVGGRYAHVIAPDRSGKSSLIAATAARLENNGIKVATLDLGQIGMRDGTPDAGRWYYNVVYRLLRQLRIRFDLQSWWQDKSILSNRQRLLEFYAEVLLANVQAQIVIFVDEMQVIGGLPFADQLLASIRSAHNARVTDPEFNRLTFVLLGECDPLDLVNEADASPFNVTQAVPLDDFSRTALNIFATELNLEAGEADEALDRIYFWTRGQPYLTQKLARAVARDSRPGDIAAQVDRIVAQQLVGRAALHSEPHMSHMHRQIVNSGKIREGLLNLYGKIRKGIAVPADLGSALQRRLMSGGLIEVDEAGELRIRNRVYESVFTARWANENMRTQWRAPLLVAAGFLVILAIPLWYTQGLPKPYAAVLTSPATEIVDAESAWRNLRSFPGHAASADNLYRTYLVNAAARADNVGLMMSIASLASELPEAGNLPEQLQASFWDRRVQQAVHAERRDDALLASIEALVSSTSVRRNRAANLVADDYPLLLASWNPDGDGRLIIDPSSLLLTSARGARVQQWSFERQEFVPRAPWAITALEVTPLVRRVIVDQEGSTRRIGLTLNISHLRLNDLRVKLIAPSGRAAEIELTLDRASSKDDIKVPASQLASLIGENLAGTWSLSVRDEAIGVAGHLVGWNLNLNSQGLEEGFQRGVSIPDPVERETEQFWTSDDGRYAVARAEHSDSARVWDLAFAKPLGTLAVNAREKLVGLSADAKQLVSSTLETVNLWDTSSGAKLASLPIGPGSSGARLSRDRQHLFVQIRGDLESQFELWSLSEARKLADLVVAGVPGLVALDASGSRIATADYDRTVRVWDFRSGAMLAQIDFPQQPTEIFLDQTGTNIAALFGTSGISVRRVDEPQQALLEEFGEGHWGFGFSNSGARMVSGRAESGFQVYNITDGRRVGPAVGFYRVGDGDPAARQVLYFSKNEDILVTAAKDGRVQLWQIPETSAVDNSEQAHIAWSPSGDSIVAALPATNALAIADKAGHVHFQPLDAEAGKALAVNDDISFLGHNRVIRRLTVSEDGMRLASVAADNTVRVWDAADGRPLPFISSLPGSAVTQMAFSPDSTLLGLLAGSRIIMLDAVGGDIVAEHELGSMHSSLAFTTDEALYLGSESGTLNLFARNRIDGWDLRHVWQGRSPIRKLEASPRGRYLVLVDGNHRAIQFNLATAQPGQETVQLPGAVNDVRFNPSGSRVLFLTSRWVHRVGSSKSGLLWLDAMLVPKALNGSRLLIPNKRHRTRRPNEDFYLPVERNGAPRLQRFRFANATGAGLFGQQDELLAEWQRRLGR